MWFDMDALGCANWSKMDTTLSNLPDSWNEVDGLISILRAWGISYLVGLDHGASASKIDKDQQSAVALIQRLAQCDEYPRVTPQRFSERYTAIRKLL